ncbi:tripartite tricarboxylate transporter substrate binding protein [soil metagenome]
MRYDRLLHDRRRLIIGAGIAAAGLPLARAADDYPSKPIKLIVPWAAGGGTDVVVRKIAPAISERLGQNLYIDNKGGATGAIGSAIVAQSPPDGYTLLIGTADSHSIIPHLYKKLAYDARRDFTGVSPLCFFPYALAVHPSVKARDAREFVALAKASPGQLTFASWGVGSSAHVAAEMLSQASQMQVLHVPYTSTAPMMLGLVGGQVNAAIVPMPLAEQYTRGGSIRLLGLAGPKRFTGMPELPTLAEQGYDVNAGTWVGIMGPANLPARIRDRIHEAADAVLATPSMQADLVHMFVEPNRMSVAQYDAFLDSEYSRWGKVIDTAAIKVET